MKKRIPSFLGGFLTAVLLAALTTTALAASGNVTFNFANVALNGETKIAAGTDITAANGQQIPGSILYTDAAGGKTNYLPIRTISDLLGVEIGYDSVSKTVLLGEQPAAQAAAARWKKVVDGNSVTYESEKTDASYDSAPLYRPTWQAEGWGLASLSTDMQGVKYAMWRYLGDGGTLSLTCANPVGGSYGFMPGLADSVKNCQKVTIQGYQADLYADIDSYYLAWENSDGILFTMRGPDADTLKQAAESVRPYTAEAAEYQLSWLPQGYTAFDRSALGGTVDESWMKDGMALTWLQATEPVAVPEGAPETVTVGGVEARYWAAEEPYEEEDTMEVNGETVRGNSASAGGASITSGTIPGVRSTDVSTLAWTSGGVNFRLQSILDKDTMIRIAEHVALKK